MAHQYTAMTHALSQRCRVAHLYVWLGMCGLTLYATVVGNITIQTLLKKRAIESARVNVVIIFFIIFAIKVK